MTELEIRRGELRGEGRKGERKNPCIFLLLDMQANLMTVIEAN